MKAVETATSVDGEPDQVWRLMLNPFRHLEWVETTQRMLEMPPGVSVSRVYTRVTPFPSERNGRWSVSSPTASRSMREATTIGMPVRVELTSTGAASACRSRSGRPGTWHRFTALLGSLTMRRRDRQILDAGVVDARRLLEEDT